MKAVYRVLQQDPVLKKVIRVTGELKPLKYKDPYSSLINSIIYQQLSTKAADTIKGRFLELFHGKEPEPELIRKISMSRLRGAGLSKQKSSYIKNVAEFATEGGLDTPLLKKLSDTDLIGHLTQIKGVGTWTAEMLAMFALKREDIFPVTDLGIRNAVASLYGMKTTAKTFERRAVKISEHWQPFRTHACRHLWLWKDQPN
jgi:DNA-3-methyladenine glycosylase II